jgi:phage shock protein A
MLSFFVNVKRAAFMAGEGTEQIEMYRATAREMGDTALKAINNGDVGLARQAARQAAQYARVVVQLETGERWIEPEEQVGRMKAEG